MVSVLRNLQAEWNALVPEAQARGIRRVRLLNAPLESIEYRRTRLEWLRAQLGTTIMTPGSAIPQSLGDIDQFTFGVEAEVMMPVGMTASRLAQLITQAGVECNEEGYGHATRPHWKIVTDGSLGDYTRGREVVSPKLQGPNGFAAMRKVFDTMKANGCKISKKCGLHVHVGVRGESVQFFKNLVVLYSSAQVAIDSFMAPSRRGPEGGNGFCRNIRLNRINLTQATTLEQVAQAIGQTYTRDSYRATSRYCKLNLQPYWMHGTVEFRQHQGTVESDKAENWVRLCLRMCLTSRGTEKTARTVEELMLAVEATEGEREFFHDRVRRFNPGAAAPVAAAARQAAAARSEVFTQYGEFAQTPPARR